MSKMAMKGVICVSVAVCLTVGRREGEQSQEAVCWGIAAQH